MRKQITAVLAVAGLAPLTLAAPASAAPGNGAQRYSFSECFSEEVGEQSFRYCFTVRGRFDVTETPSGNFHVVDKSTQTSTFTSAEGTASSTFSGKVNVLFKKGRAQVIHDRGRFTSTFDGLTCSGSYRFMIVKEVVKKDLFSFSCDGDPEAEPAS